MTSRKEESIHEPARTQKRFGLLCLLVVAVIALPTLSGTQAAAGEREARFSVLYNFTGGADGGNPYAAVIRDEAGNLYGTTYGGGSGGWGVVFKLDRSGNETVLYNFTGGADGGNPFAGVIRDEAGNLYGTTYGGGNFTSSVCAATGCGVVFKLDLSGKETVLHTFTGGADGGISIAGLIRDEAGNLYGTTFLGGASGAGAVFKLDCEGKETVLHSFTGDDGIAPYAGLIRDEAGNLYGTTSSGGPSSVTGEGGEGVVFKLDPSGKYTVLYSFTGGADGGGPLAGLVRDAAGNLYGTTSFGGNLSSPLCADVYGCGVVFKVDRRGEETTLYTFTGPDGALPQGGLTLGDDGLWDRNLYGTTSLGGSGAGTVFKVGRWGKETVLHSFQGPDGVFPLFVVLLKHRGSLYGTASGGGAYGGGVVFKITLDDDRRHHCEDGEEAEECKSDW